MWRKKKRNNITFVVDIIEEKLNLTCIWECLWYEFHTWFFSFSFIQWENNGIWCWKYWTESSRNKKANSSHDIYHLRISQICNKNEIFVEWKNKFNELAAFLWHVQLGFKQKRDLLKMIDITYKWGWNEKWKMKCWKKNCWFHSWWHFDCRIKSTE